MRVLVFPILLLLLAPALMAQYTPQVDPNSMLQDLDNLQQKVSKTSKAQLNQDITDFSNASSDDTSALNFYYQAIYVTRYQGRPNADSDFRDWKKRESDENRLSPFAIRVCLLYMTLSLQRIAGLTDPQTINAVFSYMDTARSLITTIESMAPDDAAVDAGPSPGQRGRRRFDRTNTPAANGLPRFDTEIVDSPISGNIFATWYNIGGELGAIPKWEQVPINLNGISDKFLLPAMRKTRDRRLLDYWAAKITAATAQASKSDTPFSVDSYNSNRLPQLLWARAEDTIVIGLRDQGLNEMYQLVKQYPNHPDAGKWISELKGLIAKPDATPAPSDVDGGGGN